MSISSAQRKVDAPPVKREVEALLAACQSPVARVKFPAAKALLRLSECDPARLYPHIDFFASRLRHENSILRWNAILALANLAPADTEGKLDRLLRRYLAPIAGPHLIDAGNTIRGAAVIAVAKPYLADIVARSIRRVECATYDTPECRNIAIGHALNALTRLLPLLKDPGSVRRFATRQLDNSRPATRRKAEKLARQ